MKLVKSLLAVSVLAGAAQAHADNMWFWVTGQQDATKVIGATATPTITITENAGTPVNSANSGLTATGTPDFSGIWAIDLSTNSLKGGIDFEDFTSAVKALTMTATITAPNNAYTFNGGTVSYDASTRTLTLGQALNYASPSNSATTDASLKWNTADNAELGVTAGVGGVCSGNSTVCGGQTSQFLGKPDVERFYMTLTFNSDFTAFDGSAVAEEVGGSVTGGTTGNQWSQWHFHGEVPVPAAAWLFGSALTGLAGVARRRQAA